MKKGKNISKLIIIVISLFLLTSCDVENPVGIRYFGHEKNIDRSIVAVAEYWVAPNVYYISMNGGHTWFSKDIKFEEYKFQRPWQTVECVTNCEFEDLFNPDIRYRIITDVTFNKALEVSWGEGEDFKRELEIPAWNQMQKNYITDTFDPRTYDVPIDVRGPFSAVYDAKHETLLVAMGLEGIITKTKDQDWQYIAVGPYKFIETPNRLSMLKLINLDTWVKGILIALFTFTVAFTTINRCSLKFKVVFLLFITFLTILIDPIDAGVAFTFFLMLLKLLEYPAGQIIVTIIAIAYPCILLALLFAICRNLVIFAQKQERKQISKLILFSIFCTMVYYSSFILWSQGIFFSKYQSASRIGLLAWIISLVIASISLQVYQKFRQKTITNER